MTFEEWQREYLKSDHDFYLRFPSEQDRIIWNAAHAHQDEPLKCGHPGPCLRQACNHGSDCRCSPYCRWCYELDCTYKERDEEVSKLMEALRAIAVNTSCPVSVALDIHTALAPFLPPAVPEPKG